MIDYFLRSNISLKISTKDLPMVCFVVTQHSESALSLCLRYSKTSCEATPQKNSFPKTVICYLLFVTQKIRFWKLSTVKL